MSEPEDSIKHLTVKLLTVQCRQAADIVGGDGFYVAGGAGTGRLSGPTSTAILGRPIDVNEGRTRMFPAAEAVVFDGDVRVGDFVELGLEFRDRRFGETDFDAGYPVLLSSLTSAVGSAVGRLAVPEVAGAVAQAILDATAPALVSVLDSIEKHDVFGVVRERISASMVRHGRNGPYAWYFADLRPGAVGRHPARTATRSDSDYKVTYVVDVTPAG